MEHIARDQHDLGRELDDLVDRARERLRHVGFALVDAARSQPLILAEAEMQIGEVDEAQMLWGRGPAEGVAVGEPPLTGCAYYS